METTDQKDFGTTRASKYQWLRTGEDGLRAMLAAIDAAKESVRFEMYIFAADAMGQEFRTRLVKACQRGVRVQVLIDALGSMELPTGFWTPLIQAGGGFRWFNPLSLGRLVYRDHRKLLVCDREHGFIGGFNVGSQYCGDGITRGWRDLGFRVSGELARVLAESFDIFFARAESRHKRFQRLRASATETTATGAEWRLLLTRPGLHQSDLRKSLAQDLAMAREVRIMSAYFLPTWRLRKDIRRVAQNGGSVQLILAGKSDVRLSKLASRRLYSQMLRAGVEVHEYMPQVLHAKLFIVDDVVYVGSANFDTRSLVINYELQVRLSEQRVADEAKQIFRDDLAHCRRIDPLSWRHSRGFFEKLMESWAYFVLARIDPYIARRQLKRLQ